MNGFDNQIIFKQLLEKHHRIQIPMIQRDYAQGRETEVDVRNEFLNALYEALMLDPQDSTLPLNLDFVYGSVEGENNTTSFLPLDGQQRLTTLFLLHWYLAWTDGCLEGFKGLMYINNGSRFSYSVRQSSKEFFDALINYVPNISPNGLVSVQALITNQPWYFRYWRLDPTIQASLIMLDSIHERFHHSEGLYSRLMDENQPAVTFQLLDLENFGLSDDLYIKMNARGKPLTVFETFKARYEQELEKLFSGEFRNIGNQRFSVVEYFSRRMDTRWADFFWAHRDSKTNLFDDAVMNLFHALILVTRDPDAASYVDDITSLRSKHLTPSYTSFHGKGWLDKKFSETLFLLLDEWSTEAGAFSRHLPDTKYFDEKAIYQKAVHEPSGLDYSDIILFVAYVIFLEKYQAEIDAAAFQNWMRVVYNLSVNTVYNRPSDMQRSITSLLKAVPESGSILEYMANPDSSVAGFRQQQVNEEQVKAELILANEEWWALIENAEGHGYFNGQIEFLLDFSGVLKSREEKSISEWDVPKHQSLQRDFKIYFEKANLMFNSKGLVCLDDQLWERALLSIGDYLLPKGSNYSFLVNSATDDASWKRLLREDHEGQRNYLKQLWDRLNPGDPLDEQLLAVINDASGLDRWIKALVDTPEAIKYCGKRAIRWVSENEIYLLSKTQMNGAHAELFTYCLQCGPLQELIRDGKLFPLSLPQYQTIIGSDERPYIRLLYRKGDIELNFYIESENEGFTLSVEQGYLEDIPRLKSLLTDALGLSAKEGWLAFEGGQEDIINSLVLLAQTLNDYS